MKTGVSPAALGLGGFAALLFGWAIVHTVTAPKLLDVIVIDYSGSTAAIRQQQLGLAVAGLEADPPNTTVAIFRMGSKTQEIFSGSLDDTSVESVAMAVKDETAKSDPHDGTNFANMAESVASVIDGNKAARVRIRIFSDGEDDFANNKAVRMRYREAADHICTDLRLESVTFVGVKSGFREAVRLVWKQAGSKLQVIAAGQVADN